VILKEIVWRVLISNKVVKHKTLLMDLVTSFGLGEEEQKTKLRNIGSILFFSFLIHANYPYSWKWEHLRPMFSHMRLRDRDHCTSSTLIGGKGRANPSSPHTTLEGPMEYVNAKWWMWSLHGFLHGIRWSMFHGHLGYFQIPPLGGRPNTKLEDHGIPNTHNNW